MVYGIPIHRFITITEILANHLTVSKDRIYVKYDEVSVWGLGGENF